jgi:hypothetical protein
MNRGGDPKVMHILEIDTPRVQNQSSDRKFEPEESSTPIGMSASSQAREGDVVVLSFSSKQNLSSSYVETQSEDNQSVQDISSVARAVLKYSQVVEGDLNEDETTAIKQIVARIEPIAREFLASDPVDVLNFEKLVGIFTEDQEITEKFGVALGNVILKTLDAESFSQGKPDNTVQSESIEAVPENPDMNVENIRYVPELAVLAVDTELQKQFDALNESSKVLIISSLNDLMRFFHENISKVLEPLKYPVSLGTGEVDLEDSKPQS